MFAIATAALVGLLPVGASAQSDGSDGGVTSNDAATAAVGPTLDCNLVGLRILVDDLNAARVVCRVTGASGSDTSFTISAIRPSGGIEPRPLCANGLSAGVGTCLGGVVDPASPISLRATLQPSGSTIGPVLIGPASAQPSTEPMQFFPLGE